MCFIDYLNLHYKRNDSFSSEPPIDSSFDAQLTNESMKDGMEDAGKERRNWAGGFPVDLAREEARNTRSKSAKATPMSRYSLLKDKLFVLVDEVESLSLSDQQCLVKLAQCPSVGLVVTATHLNTHLLWDNDMLAQFRWRYVSASTFEPFTMSESSVSVYLGSSKSNEVSEAGLEYVLRSLSHSHKEILSHLCRRYMEIRGKGTSVIQLPEVYQDCKSALIVKTRSEFNKLLKELIDHNIAVASIEAGEMQSVTLRLPEEAIAKLATEV